MKARHFFAAAVLATACVSASAICDFVQPLAGPNDPALVMDGSMNQYAIESAASGAAVLPNDWRVVQSPETGRVLGIYDASKRWISIDELRRQVLDASKVTVDGEASTMCTPYAMFDVEELGTVIVEGSSVQNISYPIFWRPHMGSGYIPVPLVKDNVAVCEEKMNTCRTGVQAGYDRKVAACGAVGGRLSTVPWIGIPLAVLAIDACVSAAAESRDADNAMCSRDYVDCRTG